MNIQEMRSCLEKGMAANRMGSLPDSMPDAAIQAVFNAEARRRDQLRKSQTAPVTRNAQRPTPRVGAIVATASEQERLDAHRRIIQADLLQ